MGEWRLGTFKVGSIIESLNRMGVRARTVYAERESVKKGQLVRLDETVSDPVRVVETEIRYLELWLEDNEYIHPGDRLEVIARRIP